MKNEIHSTRLASSLSKAKNTVANAASAAKKSKATAIMLSLTNQADAATHATLNS